MRILLVLHIYPPDSWGGTELHVRALARELAAEHEVRIFCRGFEPLLEQDAVTRDALDGIPVVRFNNLFFGYRSFAWTYAYRPAHEAFLAELEAFSPDVVHVHHLTGLSTTIIEACKLRDVPVVLSLHDFWMVCPRGQRLHPELGIQERIDREVCRGCLARIWPHWFGEDGAGADAPGNDLARFDAHMRRMFGLADLVLTPSAFHRERMLEGTGIDPDRIRALPHGLDHAPFTTPHDPAPRPRVIGYIGAVVPTKGVHVLLEAFLDLKAGRPELADLELRIHGDTPSFHENSEYAALLATRAEIDPGIRLLGHYDNEQVAALLREVDILVVPSLWWETFSLTIRESVLAGVPVVASDIGAMREAIEATGAGLCFRTGDPGDLARVLGRLVEDDALRARLSNRGGTVKTIRRNAEDVLAIYREAQSLSERRRGSIDVTRSHFPEGQRGGRRTEFSPSGETDRDLSFTVEKLGEGDVRVRSSVERDAGRTRVTFVFDYDPEVRSSEVRLDVAFRGTAGAGAPAAGDASPGARSMSRAMARGGDAETHARSQEREMDARRGLDVEGAADRLDAMVGASRLEDDERTPRGRAPREDDDAGRGEDGRRGRRRGGRGRDRDEDGRREERGESEGRRARRERDDDRDGGRRAERGPARRDERERDEAPARARREGGGRDRGRDRDDDAPRRGRSAGESERPRRDAGRGNEGDLVWGGDSAWSLPEPAPEAKPRAEDEAERAPNHRLGRQPGHGGARDGGFGEGVGR